ncbi:MAG TPA: hypothetical protein DCQ14_05470 [Firmicutes bacterium]|nr:hypothetical protein [Bacillota bacterium]
MGSKKKNVALIGLGTMGTPMAQRLLKKGFPLLAYDPVLEKVQRLVTEGAEPAASAREAAAGADIIISMVAQSADTEKLVLGQEGIIYELRTGKFFIDMSPSSLELPRRIYGEINTRKGEMLDAPVSGGHNKAKKGKLTIMVGGDRSTFEKCKKLFYAIGQTVHYTGAAGSGQAFKLLNNILYAVNMCAAAEVLTLGEKLGMKLSQMVEVFNSSSAASYCLDEKIPTFVLTDDFTPGLRTALLLKDIELALELGESAESMQVFGRLAHQFFRIACESGLEGEDNSAVIKIFRTLAKIKL